MNECKSSVSTDVISLPSYSRLVIKEWQINIHGTNPNNADTDSDGLNDWIELNTHETDPTLEDTDEDGLNDGEEINDYDTNPIVKDSDGDGLEDGDEINTYDSNPTLTDTDDDGVSDQQEQIDGTDPLVDNTPGENNDPNLAPNICSDCPQKIPGRDIFISVNIF